MNEEKEMEPNVIEQSVVDITQRKDLSEQMISYARSGDRFGVKQSLDASISPNYKYSIEIAYASGAMLPVQGGGTVGSVTSGLSVCEETALAVASYEGHFDIVELLLSRGANTNQELNFRWQQHEHSGVPYINKETALSIALREKQDEVAIHLINNRANVNFLSQEARMGMVFIGTYSLQSMLYLAIKCDCSCEVIKALLDTDSDLLSVESRDKRPEWENMLLGLSTFCGILCCCCPEWFDEFSCYKDILPIELAESLDKDNVIELLQHYSKQEQLSLPTEQGAGLFLNN